MWNENIFKADDSEDMTKQTKLKTSFNIKYFPSLHDSEKHLDQSVIFFRILVYAFV